MYVFIISYVLVKFQDDKKLIIMLSIKCLNFKFFECKFMQKNNLIDQIINNILFGQNLTYVLRT